jgi:ketosteroid isomerase-like protein
MSEENVEVVHRFVAAISSGDYDEAASMLHPDAEWHNTAVFPGPTTVRGAPAITRFLRDLFEEYSGPAATKMEIEKVADSGNLVVIHIHGRGHGRGSGIPLDIQWAHALCLDEGKVLRVKTYGRYAKALEAAGLRE